MAARSIGHHLARTLSGPAMLKEGNVAKVMHRRELNFHKSKILWISTRTSRLSCMREIE